MTKRNTEKEQEIIEEEAVESEEKVVEVEPEPGPKFTEEEIEERYQAFLKKK